MQSNQDTSSGCNLCTRLCALLSGSKSSQSEQAKSNQILPANLLLNSNQMQSPRHLHLAQFTPPSFHNLQQATPSRTFASKSINMSDLFASMRLYAPQALSASNYHSPRNMASSGDDNEPMKILAIFDQQDRNDVTHLMNRNATFTMDIIDYADDFIQAKNSLQGQLKNQRFDGIFVGPSFTKFKMEWMSFLIWLRQTHENDIDASRTVFAIFVSAENQYVDYLIHSSDPNVLSPFAFITLSEHNTIVNVEMI